MQARITCGGCGKRAMELVVAPYHADLKHDGRSYVIDLPALEYYCCANCSEIVLPDSADEIVGRKLRRVAGLLMPEEIKSGRNHLKLFQSQLAEALCIGESTLCRWETGGQIQQRAFDKLLRLYFDVSEARDYLDGVQATVSQSTRMVKPVLRTKRSIAYTRAVMQTLAPFEFATFGITSGGG